MKKFNEFLSEDLRGALVEPKSAAAQEAKRLNLQYVGFGRYMDPQSGQVTHIVQNDKLIPFSKASKTNTFKKNSSDDFGSYVRNMMPDIQQHHDILTDQYKPENYSDEELDAVQTYTSSTYLDINELLNELPAGIPANKIQPQFAGDDLPAQIANIDSALDKTATSYEFTVWTGLSSAYKAEDFMPGRTFQFKGFRSTSLNPNIALNFNADNGTNNTLLLQINIKKGTKGMYVDEVSSTPGESEFLLPRASRLRVKSGPHLLQGSNAYNKNMNQNVQFFICDIVK